LDSAAEFPDRCHAARKQQQAEDDPARNLTGTCCGFDFRIGLYRVLTLT
jgi:hypothetical protein